MTRRPPASTARVGGSAGSPQVRLSRAPADRARTRQDRCAQRSGPERASSTRERVSTACRSSVRTTGSTPSASARSWARSSHAWSQVVGIISRTLPAMASSPPPERAVDLVEVAVGPRAPSARAGPAARSSARSPTGGAGRDRAVPPDPFPGLGLGRLRGPGRGDAVGACRCASGSGSRSSRASTAASS